MVKKIGLILGITMMLGLTSCNVKFGKMEYSERDYDIKVASTTNDSEEPKLAFSMNEESDSLDKIDIKMKNGIVTFNESKTGKVVVNIFGEKEFLDVKTENKTLEINDTYRIVGEEWGEFRDLDNDNLGTIVNIELPKDFNKNIDINIGIGVVYLDKISINEGNINIGVGGVMNKEMIKVNKLNANVMVGATDLLILDGKDIKINQELGSTKLTLENINGKVDIKNKIGETQIGYLNGDPKCSGTVKIGDKIIDKVDGNGSGEIKSTLNIGENFIMKLSEKEFTKRKREYFTNVEIENIIENIS